MDDYEDRRVQKLRGRTMVHQEAAKKCTCDEIMAKDPTRHFRGCPKREEHPDHPAAPEDMLELAWGIIANVSNGNWENQSPAWQEAAKSWRDRWHKILVDSKMPTAKLWPPLPEK